MMSIADSIYSIVAASFIVSAISVTYRLVTSSESRLYAKMLRDILGPFGEKVIKAPELSDLRIRGSLQITRIVPARIQLPMSKGEFVKAFERLAPGQIGRALGILGNTAPEEEWKQFLDDLSIPTKTYDDFSNVEFQPHDVKQIRAINEKYFGNFLAIREELWKLFPDVNDFIKNYDEFLSKFSFALRRRNLRQNVFIAAILVVWEDLSFTRLFDLQTALSPDRTPVGPNFLWSPRSSGQLSRLLVDNQIVHIATHLASFIIPTIIVAVISEIILRRVIGEDPYGVRIHDTQVNPLLKEEKK